MNGFEGKVVLVTGASSGIGRATALMAAERGAMVSMAARRAKEIETAAKSIPSDRKLIVGADLTEENDRAALVAATIEKFGRIDVLVNAAGIIGSGTIENTTAEHWDTMFDINLRSLFRLTQLALPAIIESKGSIVNVSSVTGTRAFPGVLAYCVSKAGVDQFTRCIALELAPKGVRVNAVNPGVVVTNLHRAGGFDEEQYKTFLAHSRTTHPMGRVGQPEEVAELILFLASGRSGWTTGATISIDGGRALTCAR
ncbi:MAG TPA: glucose 1-dehydrogenase [Bacteroidota bacterium]|nr:glucose 1-dehydrogenase [Bacteroidota bacterium]